MKINVLFSFGLHGLLVAVLLFGRSGHASFEGYPVIMPVELVKIEPVSFKAPEVEKLVPRKEILKPQPKKLEGVTVEKKKVEEEPREERPAAQVEKPEKSNAGKSTIGGEDIQLDVEEFPFSYYLAIVQSRIQTNWEPPVTPSRRAWKKRTVVHFRIQRNGRITEIRILDGSGDYLYDQSCLRAVTLSNPLPPLPFDFSKQSLGVGFAFKQGS